MVSIPYILHLKLVTNPLQFPVCITEQNPTPVGDTSIGLFNKPVGTSAPP